MVFNVLPCQNAQQVIQKLYEEKWKFNASFYLELASDSLIRQYLILTMFSFIFHIKIYMKTK